MTTRIAFLRAVNVGARRVPMAQVVAVAEGLGYGDVWTFANSGNVVFDATGARAKLERALGEALAAAMGFEVTTFVRSTPELRRTVTLQPFERSPGDTYFVTFLSRPPPASAAAQLEAASNDFDTLRVTGRDVHWHMRGPSTATTLRKATWNLVGERASTSRNVTLLTRLAAKLDAAAS